MGWLEKNVGQPPPPHLKLAEPEVKPENEQKKACKPRFGAVFFSQPKICDGQPFPTVRCHPWGLGCFAIFRGTGGKASLQAVAPFASVLGGVQTERPIFRRLGRRVAGTPPRSSSRRVVLAVRPWAKASSPSSPRGWSGRWGRGVGGRPVWKGGTLGQRK